MQRRSSLKLMGALWALGTSTAVARARQDRAGGDAKARSIDDPRVLTLDALKNETIRSLSISPDGTRLFVWRRILDLDDGRILKDFMVCDERIGASTFSPDGRRVAAASWIEMTVPGMPEDTTRHAARPSVCMIRVWDATTGQELQAFYFKYGFTGLAFNRDATLLFGMDGQERFTAFNVASKRQDGSLIREPRHYTTGDGDYVAISADSQRAVTTSQDQAVGEPATRSPRTDLKVWDLLTERFRVITNAAIDGYRGNVALSRDGRRILVVGAEKVVMLDFDSGEVIREFHALMILGADLVTFSPDGALVLAGSPSGEVWVWDTETGRLVRTLGGPQGKVHAIAFMKSGVRIVSGGWKGWNELDKATGKQIYKVEPVRVWDTDLAWESR